MERYAATRVTWCQHTRQACVVHCKVNQGAGGSVVYNNETVTNLQIVSNKSCHVVI